MALIEGSASYRCSGCRANAALAGIAAAAKIAVFTMCSIGSNRVAAYTCCCITGARHMALIEGGANYRCSRRANAALAGIAAAAEIEVFTGCSIANRRVNACAGRADNRIAVVNGAIRVNVAYSANAG
jgi:hypothetical protein